MQRDLQTRLVIGCLGLAFVIGFQNCGQAPRNANNQVVKQEGTFLSQLLSAPIEDKINICETAANYVCNQKVFGPEVTHSQFVYNTCSEIELGGEKKTFCFDVLVFQYNTKQAIELCATCTEEDGNPGGRFNHEEISCGNQIIGDKDAPPIQGTGVMATALNSAVERCRKFLNY